MKKVEFEKFVEHILGHFDGKEEDLKSCIERYKEDRDSGGTLNGAIDLMCQYGVFDVYYDDVEETLRDIYGEDYDSSKYFNKDGSWKFRNGENYIWTIYKSKITTTINKMIEKEML